MSRILPQTFILFWNAVHTSLWFIFILSFSETPQFLPNIHLRNPYHHELPIFGILFFQTPVVTERPWVIFSFDFFLGNLEARSCQFLVVYEQKIIKELCTLNFKFHLLYWKD